MEVLEQLTSYKNKGTCVGGNFIEQLHTSHIPDFHLWLVVTFHHLRGEILQTKSCLQGGLHGV